MKIAHIEAWPVTMRLSEPYVIAYESVETTTAVFLRIETDRGPTGFGCAAPDEAVCGETADDVLTWLRESAEPALMGQDPLDVYELRASPAATAMVDMALYDIQGKVRGLPLFSLLGGGRHDSIITSITIGILPEAETIVSARRRVGQGFVCLKLKGGLDWEEDAARVLKVREAVGDQVELRFDANQGFTLEESVRFARATAAAALEFIEQPTPRDDLAGLAEVARAIDVPVMADESLVTVADAERICLDHTADLVNVKLMKVGGIQRAVEIDRMAAEAGIPAMVGCMDEPALAIAAGLHLALARPNVRYADLDGHLDLLGDPSNGAVFLEAGRLRPAAKPGLGFDIE